MSNPLTPTRLKALKTAMKRQQTETRERGLPHEHIDAEALLILQRYLCKCGCGQPLDLEGEWIPETPPPGYPVVAHEYYRRGKNSPGHVIGNVWWWRHECNSREAAKENVARGRANKHEVHKILAVDKPEKKSKPKSKFKRKMDGSVVER